MHTNTLIEKKPLFFICVVVSYIYMHIIKLILYQGTLIAIIILLRIVGNRNSRQLYFLLGIVIMNLRLGNVIKSHI